LAACRVTTAVRQHAAAAYELGGLHGLALWLQARARLARLSPVELVELRELARVLVRQAAPIRKALEQQLQATAPAAPAGLSWEQKQQLLAQREAQRRAGDRQPVTLMPIITTSAAPAPRGSHSRQARGECGQRLSKKLDRLLAEVLASGAPEGAAHQPEAAPATELPAQSLAAAAVPAQSPRLRPPRSAVGAAHPLLAALASGAAIGRNPADQPQPRGRALQQPEAEILVHGPIRAMSPEGTTPSSSPIRARPITTNLAAGAPEPAMASARDPLTTETQAELSAAIGEIVADLLTTEQVSGSTVEPEPAMAESAAAELEAAAEPETQARQSGDRRQLQPEGANPAAAGDLAVPLGITGSSTPETLAPQPELAAAAESAAADLHEAVLVAAAQGDLEPELAPQPMPVSVHALEAAWAAEPAAAAAAAELSPRARAIAELGAALLQGGQTVTLPAALAAELLEALLA